MDCAFAGGRDAVSALAALNFLILLVVGTLAFFGMLPARLGGLAPATLVSVLSCFWAVDVAKKMNARKPWYQR